MKDFFKKRQPESKSKENRLGCEVLIMICLILKDRRSFILPAVSRQAEILLYFSNHACVLETASFF